MELGKVEVAEIEILDKPRSLARTAEWHRLVGVQGADCTTYRGSLSQLADVDWLFFSSAMKGEERVRGSGLDSQL